MHQNENLIRFSFEKFFSRILSLVGQGKIRNDIERMWSVAQKRKNIQISLKNKFWAESFKFC